MKIAVITNLYPPYARGGAEQVARRLVNEMTLGGHQVFVISTVPYRGWRAFLKSRGWRAHLTEHEPVPVYRFGPWNLYHLLNSHRFPVIVRLLWHVIDLLSPLPAWEVRKILKQERPDLVITHNLKGLGLPIARDVQKQGYKHIHTVHDVQLSIPSGLLIFGQERSWINRSPFRYFYEVLVKRAIGRPNLVLCPSMFLARFHRERGFFQHSRVEVLPNPAPKMKFVQRKPYDPKILNILYASQIESAKGFLFLKSALEKFDRPFKLHIAGEGVLSQLAAQWAEQDPRVVYHGYVSFENLVHLFEISDVIVVPSLCYEGSPSIIYESFQAGIPVVASRLGGVGELVQYGKNGYLVDTGNVESLLSALKKVADDVDNFQGRSEEIKATVELYRVDRYLARLENLIKETCS
ncbi:glycosyltransferase [Patescibacteria group bacterium]|nr:glycosyltransferase [Patescibacteria group bacterium]MBU1705451.1 glycosyltransferase [Patescibacteria group bacterium]